MQRQASLIALQAHIIIRIGQRHRCLASLLISEPPVDIFVCLFSCFVFVGVTSPAKVKLSSGYTAPLGK